MHIDGFKGLSEDKQIERVGLPERFSVHLVQHIGRPARPIVKKGDTVKVGQKIADADGAVSVPIHSPVSGKVVDIKRAAHPVLGLGDAIVIENDNRDELGYDPVERELEEVLSFGKDKIIASIKEAGIVGLGGATFPTHIKLSTDKPIDTLIVNAAECEPFITSDGVLLREHFDEIIAAIRVVMDVLGARQAYIGIEDERHAVIDAVKDRLASERAIHLFVLPSSYPQGGEKQLIRSILKREVPLGGLPADVGVMVHNVATLFAIYEALFKNKPLYERLTTVSGDAVADPKNLWIRIGMPFKHIIDAAKGLTSNVAKVLLGGPMMGFCQYDLDVPAIKGTGAIVCLSDKMAALNEKWSACIRCGRCIEHCPMGLLPAQMGMAMELGRLDLAKEYGLMDCIECGLCTYVCPAKRINVHWFKKGRFQARLKKG